MPFSTRGEMKRKMRRAIDAQEKSASYLLYLRSIYDPNYPEYVEAIDAILAVVAVTYRLMNEFADQI